jgi:hypothetical protein
MNVAHLADWMPMRVHWERGAPMVDWCYLGKERFVEAFFDQTLEKCLRQPFNLLFRHQTPMETLAELQAREPGVPPTGFIFHMSRCGSTLVAQMLAALPQNIVISEAGPIDAVLRADWRDPGICDEQRIAWLRGLISAYARPRHAQEQHCFIKFDSWHTLALPLIQRAFPGVPWIFLYREPVQVLVSHHKQPGAQMVPGLLPPQWLGLDWAALAGISLAEYCAQVLARICGAALHYQNDDARLINYQQLPDVLWTELAAHFRVCYTTAEIERLRQVTQFDAKNPSMHFMDDTATKAHMATAELYQLVEQWLRPVYTALEVRRRATQAAASHQAGE